MDVKNLTRNFAIIAHIDHGKSTLADRLMELTGAVEKGRHVEQMLDRNPISRERGITIKLAPVRMLYNSVVIPDSIPIFMGTDPVWIRQLADDNVPYNLNLIDTPGHVDFSYEVDRTLSCVEGVILLVDATQGIQAQTISNSYKAIEKSLKIIPVINKIDLPSADVPKTSKAIVDFLGIPSETIIQISAKTGVNVNLVLNSIIELIPPPKISTIEADDLRALIFDSYYDSHKGVIVFVRIVDGSAKKAMKMQLFANGVKFETTEVGIFRPDLTPSDELQAGDIGYIVTNLKDIHNVGVGDTIMSQKVKNLSPLPGYKKVKPMVYASMFPTDPAEYENVKRALEKIYLNDSSLDFTPIYSQALGAGFKVGFLGLLHADVIRERLETEYSLNLILTPPQVDYKREGDAYLEPIVHVMIITPQDYVGAVMTLCKDHRAIFKTMDNRNQVVMEYEMPLSEMISEFFDSLKTVTSGYASFDWELVKYQPVDADKLSLLLNGDEVEEFSEIVVQDRAMAKASFLTKKLRELIPRQQYEVKIQASFKGRIIASERVSPFRKDVLMKGSKAVGGGDVGRKRKVLERQKEGKKKMKMIGKVEVPKEAFIKLFNKQ